jgi:hypothetical protein
LTFGWVLPRHLGGALECGGRGYFGERGVECAGGAVRAGVVEEDEILGGRRREVVGGLAMDHGRTMWTGGGSPGVASTRSWADNVGGSWGDACGWWAADAFGGSWGDASNSGSLSHRISDEDLPNIIRPVLSGNFTHAVGIIGGRLARFGKVA